MVAVVGLDVPVRVVVILRVISFGFWQASDIPPAASSFDRQGITEHLTRLKLPPVSRVYCSPIMRCAQTAAAAASELGISELRVDPSLSETICEDWYVAFCHGHVRVLQPTPDVYARCSPPSHAECARLTLCCSPTSVNPLRSLRTYRHRQVPFLGRSWV